MNKEESLGNRVYCAARDGMAMTLYALLSDSSTAEANLIINEIQIVEDEQWTPLIAAAINGRERVVKMLLSEFNPDLEKEGVITVRKVFNGRCDESIIEGATALMSAVSEGHLDVVKLLVKAGADVNHPTRRNTTPVRGACSKGHLEIVKFLTEHCADVNIANTHNSTCLITAAYRGNLDLVSFLLENKANPNAQAVCGATALHYAAEYGHMSILKKLLNYNANFFANNVGMTPIKLAAERTQWEIVDYLVSRPEISKEEKIEALELLGASLEIKTNDGDAYRYLHQAMKMRYSDPDNIIEKKLIEPIPAYENCIESQNLSELKALEHNPDGLQMQALTICERILGKHHPDVLDFVLCTIYRFEEAASFDRCIELCSHILDLRLLNKASASNELLRFAELFSRMVHEGAKVAYDCVIRVLAVAIAELEQNNSKIVCPDGEDVPESVYEDMQIGMKATLNLLMILTRLLNNCNEEERLNVKKMVSRLNHLQEVRFDDGNTLLHKTCYAETFRIVADYHINEVCKYPCAETARLLIQSGADVNALDYCRNTPFHLILNYHDSISDVMTLQIVKDLAGAGAHIYCLINLGDTSHLDKDTGIAEMLKAQAKLSLTSLKCMAAIAVRSHRLSYQGRVPQAIQSFIELHDTIRFKSPVD